MNKQYQQQLEESFNPFPLTCGEVPAELTLSAEHLQTLDLLLSFKAASSHV